MTLQFKRSLRLNVGGIEIEQRPGQIALQVDFSVQRGAGVKAKGPIPPPEIEPNNCEIAIWNLSPDSRGKLEGQSDVPVRLEVGYEDTISQIFFGNLRNVESTHVDGIRWMTRISGGDGEKQLAQAHVSRSFKVGTPYIQILIALGEALNLGTGGLLKTIPPIGVLSQTRRFHGPASTELQAFCNSIGYYWSIQDGEIQIAPNGLPARLGVGPLISPVTGLIGSPTVDSRGVVHGVALLKPDLVPGIVFAVASRFVTGAFIAQRTRHHGSNLAKEWYVDFEGVQF